MKKKIYLVSEGTTAAMYPNYNREKLKTMST